jgi:hypothetical protein
MISSKSIHPSSLGTTNLWKGLIMSEIDSRKILVPEVTWLFGSSNAGEIE